jgi:hypothetical protein
MENIMIRQVSEKFFVDSNDSKGRNPWETQMTPKVQLKINPNGHLASNLTIVSNTATNSRIIKHKIDMMSDSVHGNQPRRLNPIDRQKLAVVPTNQILQG